MSTFGDDLFMHAGPGCSSMAFGFAEELGPFYINPDGKTLRLNPNSANRCMLMFLITSEISAPSVIGIFLIIYCVKLDGNSCV